MERSIDNKKVFRAELHVHTPSSLCYKGPKTDEEYLRIVEAAHEKKINILAITDHNSVKGYFKIQKLKQIVYTEYNTLVNIKDSREAKVRVKQLKKTVEAFDSVFLIPGVEFEVNNGIHLLVLFNPETPESTIDGFLTEGGYEEKSFGKETDVFSTWSIFDLYKNSRKYDCVVIDAHSDSNKGIYNTLSGQSRVHAFIDSSLVGICYKNEKQKNSIKEIIYQNTRTTPVAFLKSSDSHQISEIGQDLSFFRIEEKNWTSFKEAFDNPAECIFTTYPEMNAIIKKVASSGNCLFIGQLDGDTRKVLAQNICGLSNSNSGFIIIGADSIHSINGVSEDDLEELHSIIQQVHEDIQGLANIGVNIYPIKDKSVVLVVRVPSSEDLLGVDQDKFVYYYQNNQINTLNASEIQSLITLRLTSRLSERLNVELDNIRKKTTAIDTYFKSLPILNSFYNNSVFLGSVITEVKLVYPIHLTAQQFASLKNRYERNPNGVSRGNVFFFENEQKPRLSDAYLRISLPRFSVKGLKSEKEEPALYFIPGGAVFYSARLLNCYYNMTEPVLRIATRNDYPLKFLCAYLKSSFYLWYLINRFNTFDVIPPSHFNCLKVPQLYLKNKKHASIVRDVEKLFDDILSAEASFLANQRDIKDPELIIESIRTYNESVQDAFVQIDELFFLLLNLNDGEKQTIKDNLKANGVYMPDKPC